MRVETQTIRIGENVGPVDWDHPIAKDMPAIWREAEKRPSDFKFVCDNYDAEIFAICMYDGWPYWKPTPAIYHGHPLGHGEWSFFNSYGVHPDSIRALEEHGGREPTAPLAAKPEGGQS